MPRNYVRKGNYRSRSIGKGVEMVGVSMPEGLLKLLDRMVAGGVGVSRQDVILRAIAAYAVMEDRTLLAILEKDR